MTTVLCIPEKYIPIILHQYHDEVLSGHQGVRKLTETISRRYYFPVLHTIIRQYVISCLKCQSMKRKEENASIQYPRIPLDYMSHTNLSALCAPGQLVYLTVCPGCMLIAPPAAILGIAT